MEFTDFECPFCRQFEAQTMPTIQSDYIDKGIVQLAFRHLPLTTIHPAAMGAAKATLCAGQQHHFWQLHDVLFAPTAPLNDDTYRAYVVEAKLNRSQYEACVGGWAADQIARDVAMAAALRISTTPSFVIGAYRPDGTVKASRVFRGAKPLEGFRLAIQEVLRTVQE
jgi:protein-disulfide isomerase